MARYSALVADVRPWVPECPDRSIEDYARRTVIEFCRRSRFWLETLSIPLVHLQTGYEIPTVRPEGRPDQVLHASFVTDPSGEGNGKNVPLRHASHGQIKVPGHSTNMKSDPMYFSVDRTGRNLELWPQPSVDTQTNPRILLYVVAVPNRSSRQFPDDILEEWQEALVDGILWKLMRMKNKPWTDIQASQLHRAEFFRQVNDARRETMTDGHATQRTRLRRWV